MFVWQHELAHVTNVCACDNSGDGRGRRTEGVGALSGGHDSVGPGGLKASVPCLGAAPRQRLEVAILGLPQTGHRCLHEERPILSRPMLCGRRFSGDIAGVPVTPVFRRGRKSSDR